MKISDWDYKAFFRKLETRTTRCRKLVSFGGRMSCGYKDGQKYICLDPDVAPKTKPSKYYKCMYSKPTSKQGSWKPASPPRLLVRGPHYLVKERERDVFINTKLGVFDTFYPCDVEGTSLKVNAECPKLWSSPSCLVYSFGVGTDTTFDASMVEYGCKGFAFDMIIRNDTNRVLKNNLHYLSTGLDSESYDVSVACVV